MTAKTQKRHDTGCLVAYAVDIFGDRWTLLVLRDLLLYGKKRYGEFMEADERIATNILSDRLKRLEDAGIVTKTRDPENGRSYIYHLTDKGLGLLPALLEIIRWSGHQTTPNARRKALVKRIETDRDGLIQEVYEREGKRP